MFTGQRNDLLIGIAGGSGAGKSSLCKTLLNLLKKRQWSVELICHDNYYKDISHLPLEQRAKNNFDHPDSLDTVLLVKHLKALKKGYSVRIPTYDFKTHSRTKETVLVRPAKVILIEGILILETEALVKELDLSFFVESRSDTRLSRRIKRDVRERGRTMESVLTQFRNTVQPMYEKFVHRCRLNADVIISGEKWPSEAFLEFMLRGICVGDIGRSKDAPEILDSQLEERVDQKPDEVSELTTEEIPEQASEENWKEEHTEKLEVVVQPGGGCITSGQLTIERELDVYSVLPETLKELTLNPSDADEAKFPVPKHVSPDHSICSAKVEHSPLILHPSPLEASTCFKQGSRRISPQEKVRQPLRPSHKRFNKNSQHKYPTAQVINRRPCNPESSKSNLSSESDMPSKKQSKMDKLFKYFAKTSVRVARPF